MKNAILKLRAEGLSYAEICNQLSCSKSIISYYCNNTTKIKTRAATKRLRQNNTLTQKVTVFKSRGITTKTKDFKRRDKANTQNSKEKFLFFASDVIQKIGDNPICYLTGRKIDLTSSSSYQFDHIIPHSKGGANSLDNLGLTCKAANLAKHNLTLEEFISLCSEVLNHHGYKVAVPDRIERSA